MFSVDYATLQQIIQQFMYTGVFRAYVTETRLLPEEGSIELQAKEGNIIACRFITRQGQVYQWERWETELVRFGILNWEMTTASEAASQGPFPGSGRPASPSPDTVFAYQRAPAPHHTTSLHPSEISRWPMLYRQVYALIDGRRKVSDIAHMLHKSQREVAQIIENLRQRDLIAFD
ncbi:MAG TPA: hypothetical protein VKV37_19470 [Ktedonobacteraceae bacterium]|nr:hypothetical protein [Ktedonobacteraceae bacterium]